MRSVLVAGASGGIGTALVDELISRGVSAACISRRPVNRCRASRQVDARDYDAVLGAVREMADELGGFDGVVVLVGLSDGSIWRKGLEELSGEDFIRVFEVDVVATFNVVKASHRFVRDGGAIVLVSSTSALHGDVEGIPYLVAKAGVAALGKSLAKLLAPRIRVNVVAFGPIRTGWVDWTGDGGARYAARTLLGRLGDPREAADAIIFALSNKFLNGSIVVLDGGESLRGLV